MSGADTTNPQPNGNLGRQEATEFGLAGGPETCDVGANDLEANDLEANDPEANDPEANDQKVGALGTDDLDVDDLESVSFTSSIQPHGLLLTFSEPGLEILQVSRNVYGYLGIPAQDLLGQSLTNLLDVGYIAAIQSGLADIDSISPLSLSIHTPTGDKSFAGAAYRLDARIILELEPLMARSEGVRWDGQILVKRAIARLQKISGLKEFLDLAVHEIQSITGFDRVLVYQFDSQEAGSVISEVKRHDLPSFLGLHYPATDIPKPVRKLYRRGLVRFIPHLGSESVELISAEHLRESHSLDLSLSGLRSADPCCVEYHQNMGIEAILVIPLIKNNQLWGLISAHHAMPKLLPYTARESCVLLGQFIALELANKVDQAELDYFVKLRALQSEFVESISQIDDLKEALVNPAPRLLDLVSAAGAAICLEDEITLVGLTPTQEQIQALIQWAEPQIQNSLFHTHSLVEHYPEATAFTSLASGLLLLQISKVRHYYILWFRPEVLQTINWAGNPNDAIKMYPDGKMGLDGKKMGPRKSFALWQETVRYTSLPWKTAELENALDLRSAIVGIVLRKAEELARINQELEQRNQELDSFIYAASHDLKEPLRGIHNYSNLLLKGYSEVLDEVGIARLQTLTRLTRRMEALINALLKFSRLGQSDLQFQAIDLNVLVDQAIAELQISREGIQPNLHIPRPLPTVYGDSILIYEVLLNLLTNALKYNESPELWIEIGYLDDRGQSVIYVRDNGIGIRERHFGTVFRLFKRLHEQHLYGGGTGAGLAIAKKIVERHNGQMWVESTYGEGSTFYFTLGQP
jgi:light-regulated signal transduction histidine kinase (bacteriophytochrome)